MPTMKAIRVQAYGGPEQLRYDDTPIPQPGAGQVLVRVDATSVNPWDLKLASGMLRAHVPLDLPYIPGGDFSGVVESLGEKVSSLKPGNEVFGNCPRGAYAQFVAVPVETLAPKPQKLTHVESASVPVAGQTAWQGLFDHGHLEKGQRVLIHAAAGGVGSFAVQLAKWKGATVLATGSADSAEHLRSLGADQTIDYKATPFETVAKDVDLVLDLIGGQTQTRSYAVLKPGGTLVATSQPPSPDEVKKHNVRALMMQMQPSTAGLAQIAALLDAGQIRATVTATYPLSEAARAWQQSTQGHNKGKIVLQVP